MASLLSLDDRNDRDSPDRIPGWQPGEAAFEFVLMTSLVEYLDRGKAPTYSEYAFLRFKDYIDLYWPGRFQIREEWVFPSIFICDYSKTEQIAILGSLKKLLAALEHRTVPPGADYWKKDPDRYIEATASLISKLETLISRIGDHPAPKMLQ